MHGRAVWRRTCRSVARGRPGGGLRSPGHSWLEAALRPWFRWSSCRHCVAVDGFVESQPPAQFVPVGVRQDRRGLRSHLWVLRHPFVSRSAAKPRHRVDLGRGRHVGCSRDRACGTRPCFVWQRPAIRVGRWVNRRAGESSVSQSETHATVVSLSVRSLRRSDRCDLRDRCAVF